MIRSKMKLLSVLFAGLLVLAATAFFGLGTSPAQQPKVDVPGLVHTLRGHNDAVYALAFTPDGKYIVTGSFDQTVKMWNAATGKEVRTFGGQAGHKKMVLCVAVSPDGRSMVSGGMDNTVKLWDVPSTSPLKELAAKQEIQSVALSPDGQKLATAGKDGVVKIWNTKDFKELHTLKGHTGSVKNLEFSANNAILASAGSDGTVRFWNTGNGQLSNVIGAHPGGVNGVTVHPNNTSAYTVGDDGMLRFWQINGAGPREFPPLAQDISVIAISPDGNQILTTSADKVVKVSNFANGQQLRQLQGAKTPLLSATFNSNAQFVAAGTKDGQLIYWNNGNGQIVGQATAHDGPVTAVSIRPQNDQVLTAGKDGLIKIWALPLVPSKSLAHPAEILAAALRSDGSKLYTGSKDKNVRAWNLQNNQMERQFSGHDAPVTAVAISPNGAYLASGSEDATIRFWDQNNGKEIAILGGHAKTVTGLDFNGANNQMVSSSEDGTVKLWQVPVTAPKSLAHPDQITSVVITPDGARLITGCNDKQVRLWNLSNGNQERAYGGHSLPITSVAVSDNGQMVAGGSADKSFTVWNLGNGQAIKKIDAKAPVTAIDLNPDGKQAFVGLANNAIKVFNVADGKEIKTLGGHGGAVNGLIHVPQGNRLISASADKTVRIWDINSGAAKRTLKHTGPVTSLTLSKDNKLIAAGSGKTIKVWQLADGKEMATISADADVKSVAFSPKSDRIVVGEANNTARVYDLEGNLVEFFHHTAPVQAVAYHNDGKRIISAGADKVAQVWTSSLIWQQNHGGAVEQVIFSPKNNQVISAGQDKTVKIWNVADGKEMKSIAAHGDAVVGISISADATKLASAGTDKKVKVWNLAGNNNKPLVEFTVKETPQSVAITPDGKRVAVGVAGGKKSLIRVFDVALKKEIQTFDEHKGAIPALIFHTDNKTLASVSADKTARISSVGVLTALEAHQGGVTSAQFNNNGAQAITAGADKTVKLWDLNNGKAARTFGPVESPVSYVTYSRDYQWIGAAAGKTAHIWNAGNGQEVAKLQHPANVTSLAFNNDKSRIVTGAQDKQARIWEVSSKKLLQFFPDDGAILHVYYHPNNTNVIHAGGKTVTVSTQAIQRLVEASKEPLYAITRYSNGAYVLTGGAEKEAKLWNTGNGNNERTFKGAKAAIKSLAISPNNQLVAVGDGKNLQVYSFANGKELKSIETPGKVQSLQFSANSQTLVGIVGDKTIIGYNVIIPNLNEPPESFLETVQVFNTGVPAVGVAFASDNATLYSAGKDKKVKMWKLASPAPLGNFGHPNIVDAVVFSPDGKYFASGGHDGNIRIFDVEKKKQLRQITAHKEKNEQMIYGLAFSPDSKLIVSAGYDHTLKMFNVSNGSLVREFKKYDEKKFKEGHKDSVFCVAFSPDGKYIASGSGGLERVIKLWNVSNGKVVRDFNNPTLKRSPGEKEPQSHPGWIYKIRFTKDGKRLISAGDAPRNKGYVGIWNVGNGKLIAGKEMPLGAFYGLALSPDNQYIALGAGPRGRARPGLNSAYVMKLSELK